MCSKSEFFDLLYNYFPTRKLTLYNKLNTQMHFFLFLYHNIFFFHYNKSKLFCTVRLPRLCYKMNEKPIIARQIIIHLASRGTPNKFVRRQVKQISWVKRAFQSRSGGPSRT